MGVELRELEQTILQESKLDQGYFLQSKLTQSKIGFRGNKPTSLLDVFELTQSVMVNLGAPQKVQNSLDSGVDLSKYTLIIDGIKQDYNIQEMLENKRLDPKSSSSTSGSGDPGKGFFGVIIWILVTIFSLVLLTVLSWFFYKKCSDSDKKNDSYTKTGYEELSGAEQSDLPSSLDSSSKSKRNSSLSASGFSDSNASELKKIQ